MTGTTSSRKKLAEVYGCTPADVACEGCRSELRFKYCEVCAIRDCAFGKGLDGCHECEYFPCDLIEGFPFPAAKDEMLRSVPRWRRLGTEEWVAGEEARYSCTECGEPLFRGARRCRSCGAAFSVD